MYDSLSAGGDLVHAVLLMKQRMATEEEGRRFHVDDLIMPPLGRGPMGLRRLHYFS